MKSWNVTGIEFNEEDIEKAMEALDDNIYDENSFITNKLGNEYNFESHKGNLYGPKRIVECICKNKNQPVPSNLNSTNNLRRHIEDAGFEMIIKSENKSGKTSLKKEGNNMQQVNLDDEELKEKIKLFLNDSLKVKANKTTSGTKPSDIYNMLYKNYELGVSYGSGGGTITTALAFLNYEQKIQNGIYPVILYNWKDEEQNWEICYGVSMEYNGPEKWPEELIAGKANSNSKKYPTSIVYKSYTVNNEQDLDNNIENIIIDINKILSDTTQLFEKDKKESEGSGTGNDGTPNNTTPKNQILYGPPGTGKTYNTVIKAMEIIGIPENPSNDYDEEEKKTYNNILEKLKSDTDEKEFADYEYKILKREFDKLIGSRIEFITFHQSYSYEEFVEGIKPYIPKSVWKYNDKEIEENEKFLPDVKYIGKKGIFRQICDKADKDSKNNYVLIIDEINRGNISKIFGELITLIEDDKRAGEDNAITVTLPYSGNSFSVPNNLYIIGTMNTADRSIALLDTALRRRFDFEEIPPNENLLKDKNGNGKTVKFKDKTINLYNVLKNLNNNITDNEKGGLDKDHKIGHAFLINVNKGTEEEQAKKLKRAFLNKIYPLLEEYFYDNKQTIADVLGCSESDIDNISTKWISILEGLSG